MTLQNIDTNWQATLAAGDIVNFTYPSTERDAAVEKHRPCLILEIDTDKAEAVVVYGTAAKSRANVGYELRITRRADLDAASLHKPTRFVGVRHVRVPLSSERFVVSQDGSVRIGRLPQSLHERLDRIRDLLRTPQRRVRSPFCRSPRRRDATAAPLPSLFAQELL